MLPRPACLILPPDGRIRRLRDLERQTAELAQNNHSGIHGGFVRADREEAFEEGCKESQLVGREARQRLERGFIDTATRQVHGEGLQMRTCK